MAAIDFIDTQKLPESLQISVNNSLNDWYQRVLELGLIVPESEDFKVSLAKVWCSSQFIAESCTRKPHMLIDLLSSGDLLTQYPSHHYSDALTNIAVSTEAELMAELRQFRRREMVRIAWRDLAGWATLDETLMDLSLLADACIQTALAFVYQQACDRFGTPLLPNGQPQQMIVLGMGKLGAYELNYSSDIDLIFAYLQDGVLPDRKETSYGEFFTRVCKNLVKVLDEITVDGFVFRTDIRLRPYGDSGAVIMTFDGMEIYYQTQAREWERYAMIKARQVAGDFDTGKQLMAMLRAFVYRRYLDYGAFEELRSLKLQISQELRRKDRLENVKLGPGGIREIEFIGQAFQLIRGGSEKRLQTRGIIDVLTLLDELHLLTADDATQLKQSYRFLRRIENHIQQYQDKQTHDLPTDPKVQQILAYSLDYPDWHSFKHALDTVRAQVQAVFDQVFSVTKQTQGQENSQKIWSCVADDSELLQHLADYDFQDCEQSLITLKHFKNSLAIKRLTTKGLGVLNRLMPQLIEALSKIENPDETLKRTLGLCEAVAGRNVYLSLLGENPHALQQLLRLLSASPWFGDYLSRYPILFDDLLDPRTLFEPLKKADLDTQLAALLANVDINDEEQLMNVLRHFKQQQLLRVAAADIMGIIPIMVVSDYLTWIAETIVSHVVENAWRILVNKHGYPAVCNDQDDCSVTGFAVIGFGKLGGIELGYGSDLDMVFLYTCQDGNAMTNGAKSISCAQFYGRLGLKIQHILDTKLLSGNLYEVDMRLRPNGDSGLLVTNIEAYENYLKNEAWTWEHQALVRGRFIAGDPGLKTRYEAIRQRILSLPRDAVALKNEVREMRQKMRDHLTTKEINKFDLKQSKGGIADIEFIVQFAVLALAAKNTSLTTFTDNIRLLDALQAHGFMTPTIAQTLKTAYCTYRDVGHKLALQGDRAIVDETQVAQLSAEVEKIWRTFME
ncbi:Glutamate-ammonia-ligase adenylyltransferase [Crenothrix polyspora]|uniref:Bifunctional glutamine synthetase adenylyltransferase/adenylyl-removing enzyme n=1 Tax=Crenothrix polyspora TaxID=360316 RepID=A0A1R4HH67_9GAMM|nr:bifunctional [glutamate--ammonia ligase]-adenylyl-L-tyrosine phosphorylase/[glutamate--ammonia-ligase] adenylyltransferase [Crenothrix polyspora]SJM95586.1 Glutamate-ammonia-ligase adenylyltransferase [Crenothrix polyspora]